MFVVAQVGRRILRAAALRLHAAAGDQLAQHLSEQRAPLVHRRRAALGVHRPVGRVAAERFGELLRPFGEQIAEPAFAARRHVQKFVDGFDVAPFELQAIGSVRTEQAFFPRFERDAGAAGKVAALDAQIVDLLGEVEHGVAFDAEIEKSIEPFAAGVEVNYACL